MPDQEEDLVAHLLAALQEAPDTTAHVSTREQALPGGRADVVIDAEIAGQAVSLVVEAKRSALYPRDTREAIWQLRNYLAHQSSDHGQIVPMVVAEELSPGAKDLLRDQHIGYFDRSGSLYVPARGAFVFIDKPPSKRGARIVGSLFSGQRSQVLHAIWVRRADWFGVHEIARTAPVSPTTVSETLVALERFGWVESRGSGPAKQRRLADPRGLLDAWSNHQTLLRPKQPRHFYVAGARPNEIMDRLDRACSESQIKYAITGTAAAQTYAPYLSNISRLNCRLATGPRTEVVLEVVQARPVREGWNLGIVDSDSTGGELLFRERINEVWFADPLQTYLDLLQEGGRSKELAQHLRSERLGA